MISLYKRVPKASKMNPGISRATNFSSPSRQERIQMVRVREVSIVDLWAAEAYFVIAIPNELKQAMHIIVKMTSMIMIWFSCICLNANAEFSRYL